MNELSGVQWVDPHVLDSDVNGQAQNLWRI